MSDGVARDALSLTAPPTRAAMAAQPRPTRRAAVLRRLGNDEIRGSQNSVSESPWTPTAPRGVSNRLSLAGPGVQRGANARAHFDGVGRGAIVRPGWSPPTEALVH